MFVFNHLPKLPFYLITHRGTLQTKLAKTAETTDTMSPIFKLCDGEGKNSEEDKTPATVAVYRTTLILDKNCFGLVALLQAMETVLALAASPHLQLHV